MSLRTLSARLFTWRIGDPKGRYPIFSGEGAARVEGRWHRQGQEVIYCSEHYGTAMLEQLAHFNGVMPSNQHFIKIEIPPKTSYEMVTRDSLPGWDAVGGAPSRAFGANWLAEMSSCILIVPSVVSREENNVLINPLHAEFAGISPGLEQPIRWDRRLFA